MPFTAAHPAAVLPLLRRGRGRAVLVPAALVIGSMVPDVPYFLPGPLVRADTHALVSVPGPDLLLGLLLYALWQGLLAPAATALAPHGVRARLPDGAPASLLDDVRAPSRWLAVAGSVLLGTLTHLGWDTLTHPGRWGTEHVPELTRQYGPLLGVEWAQHLSSLAGMSLLALAVLRWWRSTAPTPQEPPRPHRAPVVGPGGRTLAVLAIVVPAVLTAATAAARPLLLPNPPLGHSVFLAVTAGGSAALAAAVVTAVVVRFATSQPVSGGQRG